MSSSTSFGGLNGTLTGLAKTLCPSPYLTKSISPSSINYHNNPGPHQVTVTLTLANTSGALTNVVVQDALPPELTNPIGFTASVGTAIGNPVNWTIPALAAGATATLTFQVTVTPGGPLPTNGSCRTINNFAQVTAIGSGAANSTANNMANPVTGPVHETDEASAQLCLYDYVYVPRPMHCSLSLGQKDHPERSMPSVPTRRDIGQSMYLHHHRDGDVHGVQWSGALR